ncbi:MAG: hypothetical protein IKL68_01490 [Clostridia bacterium]|nr:hypothetical protein [Clostridia bacterium]
MLSKRKKKRNEHRDCDVFGIRSQYWSAIEQYLDGRNRLSFVEEWADICEKTNGRVSYDELYELLGRDFPKAPWLDPKNRDANIRAFFETLDIPCKADETHIYFP